MANVNERLICLKNSAVSNRSYTKMLLEVFLLPHLLKLKKDLGKFKYIYIMLIPVLAYYIVFCYIPIYGLQIAFKNFAPGLGIDNSPWVGFQHFRDFFSGPYFSRTLINTLLISFYSIIFSFPASILLALMLNEVSHKRFKKTVQTISYLPHFISIVVVCGIIKEFTASTGLVGNIMQIFGVAPKSMLLDSSKFRSIYIISEIWQSIGWNSIIYLAALAGIDQALIDASLMDGAGRFRKIWHILIPGILPTIIILFILRIGSIMNVGWEKVILIYNENIYDTADVISSYVYRKGLVEQNYSYASAVGLFNSVINFVLVFLANTFSRKVNNTSLW